MEADVPTERFPIHGGGRPSTRGIAGAARAGAAGPTRCSRTCSPAARMCSPPKRIAVGRWRQKASRYCGFDFTGLGSSEGVFRQLDILLERRRPGAGRRPSARNPKGAFNPDRPQSRRRRRSCRGEPNSRRQGGCHHRRTFRSGPCHRPVQGSHRGHPQAGARWKSRSPAGRSRSAANSSTISPNTI